VIGDAVAEIQGPAASISVERARSLAGRLRDDAQLRRIAQLAGRFRSMAGEAAVEGAPRGRAVPMLEKRQRE
jgi:hypothetical protein